jgi:hypothetical protein
MTRQRSPFSYFLFAMVILGWWPSLVTKGADSSSLECQVTSGLAGTWKIGFPTQHRLEIRSTEPIEGSASIQTVDGDGVPVTYRDPSWSFSIQAGSSSAVIEMIAKHGRGNRPIRVQVTDRNQKVLLDRTLTESERGTAIPASQPWVVGIGRDVRLSQGAMRTLGNAWGEYAVSELSQLSDLPSRSDAYAGVDVLFFSSSSIDINERIRSEQRTSISGWTRQGGQLVLTWGEHAMALAKYPDLMEMIPGELVTTATSCEPGPVESLLGSQQQLQPMTCALVRLQQGRVEVGTLTSDRIKLPFLAKWAYGMGSVVWVATEIDSPQMLAWDTRPGLVKYLLKDAWEKSENRAAKQVFQSYDELTGQLNASLDTFSSLQLGNLGQLVLIAGLLALVIGPIDYFIVSRWLKRPRWTWWTLIAASLTTMMGATILASRWKPKLPSINALEIIDIDDQTRVLHGRSFIHYYAGRRGIYDFQAHHQSLSPSPQSGAKPKPQPNRIDWLGQPGKGLGGFDSNVTTQLGLPAYSLNTLETNSARELFGLGFPAAGTKALLSEWDESIDFPSGGNALTTVSGKDDLLQGSFTNPLSVDLIDATLYFAGRAYTIPSRIRPGERIPITTAIPKDIARRLQRRTFVAGEEQGVEWNPNDTGNVGRLAELLSFHRSSGAASYTGLSNRYLSVLECSDLLKLERAVVFGYLSEPVSTWTSRRDQVPVQAIGGKQTTVVRLGLKVQNNNPSTSPTREYSIPIRP